MSWIFPVDSPVENWTTCWSYFWMRNLVLRIYQIFYWIPALICLIYYCASLSLSGRQKVKGLHQRNLCCLMWSEISKITWYTGTHQISLSYWSGVFCTHSSKFLSLRMGIGIKQMSSHTFDISVLLKGILVSALLLDELLDDSLEDNDCDPGGLLAIFFWFFVHFEQCQINRGSFTSFWRTGGLWHS